LETAKRGAFRGKNEPKKQNLTKIRRQTDEKTAGSEQAAWRKWGENCTELASTALPPTCAKPPPTIRYFYFFPCGVAAKAPPLFFLPLCGKFLFDCQMKNPADLNNQRDFLIQ
jgi:hypothetical protein